MLFTFKAKIMRKIITTSAKKFHKVIIYTDFS